MTDRIHRLRIEPIAKTQRRDAFDCGEAALNSYLRRHARQNHENNIARTFVAVDNNKCVLAYYCISMAEIVFAQLPADYAKRLPRYPIPAARIGQFAVDRSVQGQGLAARMLIDALQRILLVAHDVGINVVLVDALNAAARDFWSHYGFLQLPGRGSNLFLPLATISQLFDKRGISVARASRPRSTANK